MANSKIYKHLTAKNAQTYLTNARDEPKILLLHSNTCMHTIKATLARSLTATNCINLSKMMVD